MSESLQLKECHRCEQHKPLAEYGPSKRSPDGYASRCLVCAEIEKPIKAAREPKRKDRNLRALYGISLKQFNAIVESQDYKCAICERRAPLGMDHCHASGVNRGALCIDCNFGLGQFKDSPDRIAAAIWYLHKARRAA